MLRRSDDVHTATVQGLPDGFCLDTLLARLDVPQERREAVWLRLEPLLRWSHLRTQASQPRTFGVFVTWKRHSIARDVVDAMLIIDEATCLALRRACHGRRLLLVDNTCLPYDAAA